MNTHETRPIEIRPGRRARRRAERRKKFLERLFVSFALTATALVLVLLFGQSPEPPMVEATLPDRPEPTEPVHGLDMAKEQVLAPVAAGTVSRGAQSAAERLSRPGEGGSTGQPPASIPTISSAPPVDEPPRTPAAANASPTPAEDDPPPPPVSTSPPVAVDEEAFRPPIDPIVDPACWDGWTYDEKRRECVRNDDPEPADRNEDGEEAAEEEERPEETTEPGVGNDLGGVTKGTGSVIGKNMEVTR